MRLYIGHTIEGQGIVVVLLCVKTESGQLQRTLHQQQRVAIAHYYQLGRVNAVGVLVERVCVWRVRDENQGHAARADSYVGVFDWEDCKHERLPRSVAQSLDHAVDQCASTG
ncbi:hypothetical protein D3C72_1252050 [compost metagenome]